MTPPSITNRIVAELTSALLPLSRLDSVARLEALLADLGWELPGLDAVDADLGSLGARVADARRLVAEFERGSDAARMAAVLEMIALATEIVSWLSELLDAIAQAVTGQVLESSQVRQAFVRRLVDYLVSTRAERRHASLCAVLHLTGIIEILPQPARPAAYQPEFVLRVVHWDRLPLLLSDPRALAEIAIGWQERFDAPPFVARLERLARSLRLPGGLYDQDPALAQALGRSEPEPQELRIPLQQGGLWPDAHFEAGLGVSPLSPDNPNGVGLALVPYFFGDWQAEFDLGGGWQLDINGGVDAGVGPALLIHPPMTLDVRSDLLVGDMDEELRFEAALGYERLDGARVMIFGAPGSARLDLSRLGVSVVAEHTAGGDEVSLSASFERLRLVLATSGRDSFVKALLPLPELSSEFDLQLGWSSQRGFQVGGSAEFDIAIPVHRSLGPFTLEMCHVRLSVEDSNVIVARFSADVSTSLRVFAVDVEGVGVECALSFPESGGNLGPLDLSFGLTPPSRVALEVATGAVSGQGFIEHVPDSGRYVGGLSLDIVVVGVDALAIVDTRLPADPDGFALFASLSLRFSSIPLGFGFSLSGLGGLLALERAVDAEALALGLRDGAAGAILFPADPVRDAALLVAQIDEYFPLLPGNTVVGPVAEIRWGVGDLLVGQLGLAISLPQGRIVVLASIEAVLPERRAPVLELHLDVLGVLDVEAGSLLLMGSLYDSRLLGAIELCGDTALYVSWLDNPYFVLSVGGFHPGFSPPSYAPAVLENLRRMRAEIDLGLGVSAAIETYFAVTSNTVQFGGGFEIEASAKFLLVTYTARGWFDFDVLLRFAPFLILADASAGVGVYAGDKELLGVNLAVHLEGPEPWFASGRASFEFFGVKVAFDFAVGGHAPPELRTSSDVLALVRAELANPAAWTAQHVSSGSAGLRLAGTAADSLVRPDDVLVGKQTVAPLERVIARLGETTPLQSELSITRATLLAVVDGEAGEAIAELEVGDALDWFAPAQYDVMSDRSRLSSPSYEQMIAGVSIGVPAVALPDDQEIIAPEGHETAVWAPAEDTSVKHFGVSAVRPVAHLVAASAAARIASTARGAAVDIPRVQLAGQAYVTIDATTGRNLSRELPYGAAVAAARTRAGVRVVPAHAGGTP